MKIKGYEFESHSFHENSFVNSVVDNKSEDCRDVKGCVAQLVDYLTVNKEVVCSNHITAVKISMVV